MFAQRAATARLAALIGVEHQPVAVANTQGERFTDLPLKNPVANGQNQHTESAMELTEKVYQH